MAKMAATARGLGMIQAYLLTAAVSASVAFGSGWQVNQWKHDAIQKQAIEQAASDQRELHRLEQARSSAALGVQVAARKSEARLRVDSAAIQSAYVGLRDTNARALRTAAGSLAACAAISTTYSELYLESSRAYGELAAQTGEHLIDLRVQLDTP